MPDPDISFLDGRAERTKLLHILTEKRGQGLRVKKIGQSSASVATTKRGSSRPQEGSVGVRVGRPNVLLVQFLRKQELNRRMNLRKAVP